MRREPGRVRVRLAKLLGEIGITVDPYDLWCQEGGYRHRFWDLACWGGNNAVYEGRKTDICSWDTMTKCVKHGVVIVGWYTHLTLEVCRED